MFSFLCTIYQVSPSFLDFIFPFGLKEEAKDFHFSGLKGEYRLASYDKTCALPSLDRSGRDLRFSYNLRSVEPTSRRSKEPWSIRQCAVYHTFDVENGKMIWIIVKGNKEIQKRVTEVSERSTHSGDPLRSRSNAFTISLETHMLLCNWSGENWRWYINDFEDQLQALTRGVNALEVERKPSPLSSPTLPNITSPRASAGPFSSLSRATTLRPILTGPWTRSNTLRESPQTYTRTTTSTNNQPCSFWTSGQSKGALPETKRWKSAVNDFRKLLTWPTRSNTASSRSTSGDEKTLLASPGAMTSPELPSASSDGGVDKDDKFNFKNLQAIQHIEEKVQEAMLVLKLNTEVLEQLRLHYGEVAEHAEFPQELKDECKASLHRFNKSIVGVEKDMHMLQSRTETLLHLLANRKNLMSGILQHRSSKASEFYAKESRESAARMEIMTVKMQDLAMKTKQETVSMRVITTVTLFFLPATFIATFMSTDILNFEHGKQDLQMQGLRLYLMIALPATALTFVAWYFIYYFARREARSNDQSEAVGEA
ncbi:hypothetical protein BKA58DRAFT_410329 [Alternaria rosae]|uniref:uncharacterized protein n=1 Tax=Alternaria rosae TaxID=1187941 RepID=UPI001E8DFB0C|nr:uncharacterized protein BKA58DRAFT_410329 [Alternaria rosae]KAH6872126.1 hypothetical protein BKA58DRAFT_410329 [Alternaria rosae]